MTPYTESFPEGQRPEVHRVPQGGPLACPPPKPRLTPLQGEHRNHVSPLLTISTNVCPQQ
jgi:hypothetical protein